MTGCRRKRLETVCVAGGAQVCLPPRQSTVERRLPVGIADSLNSLRQIGDIPNSFDPPARSAWFLD